MKKYVISLTLLLCLYLPATFAQTTIPNSGFESINLDGSISHWGNTYLMAVWIDSFGVSHTDSIIFDNGYYIQSSSDAHSGNLALDLRNAWNYTANEGISGAAGSDDDSLFSAWGLLNLVPTYSTPTAPFAPVDFGFYYKFTPVNGDTAYAQFILWDSIGNQVGESLILLSEAKTSYTHVYAPVTYATAGDAAFYSLSIGTFYTAAPGVRQPSLGTRLLVDDVGLDFSLATSIHHDKGNTSAQLFPNPASEKVHLKSASNDLVSYKLYDELGRLRAAGSLQTHENTISLEMLSPGIYLMEIQSGHGVECQRLVVGE